MVTVLHGQKNILGAAEQHAPFAAAAAGFSHFLGRGRGTHQADAGHFGAVIPGVVNGAVAIDDVYNALRQSDCLKDLAHFLHEQGRLLGWFEDKGIAGSDGIGVPRVRKSLAA